MITDSGPTGRRWFLVTLGLSCVTLLAIVFTVWELVEHRYFRDLDYVTLHYLYITRGIASSLLVGAWAAWLVFGERQRHEQQLEQSYEHYRSILSHMPEAVALVDEELRVVEWNDAAERLFGFERPEVLGQRLPTVPPEQWRELEEALERVRGGRDVLDQETIRVTCRGERVPVAVSYSRVPRAAHQPQFFVEVAQDIRPRLRMRDKLLELEKLTLMGQMAAGTAHHLNTPLTAMLLQIEMLRKQVGNATSSEELATIEREIRFCQVFVQNLLHFARRPQLQRKQISLCEVIEAVVTLFRPSFHLKKADVQVDLSGLRPCQILGDPNHLEAMFSALVSNAVDAIPAGGWIRIRGSSSADGIAEVHIEENGPGISEQFRARIFEPFFTTKPAGQGTGLGLAIARNIAEEHDGTLQLQNREEGGLRATVRLPLVSSAAPVQPAKQESQT